MAEKLHHFECLFQVRRHHAARYGTSLRNQTMSVILAIDLDYFPLFEQPVAQVERLLTGSYRPVDFVVEHHHEAYTPWKLTVAAYVVELSHLISHADEHHDMMSERSPASPASANRPQQPTGGAG